MSPLFRKSEEKVAREAAVMAEIDRLKALSVDDMAVALLPALGPDGVNKGQSVRVQELCNYLLKDCPDAGQLKPLQLTPPVNRGLEKLKRAEFVYPFAYQRSPVWRITALGKDALAEGTVEQRVRAA